MVIKSLTGNFKQEDIEKYEEEYFKFVKEVRGIDLTFYGNWQKDFAKLLIELAELKSDPGKEWHVILDVGCATGLNLRAIDELGIFSRLIGTDISNYMINKIIPGLHNWGDSFKFYATPSHDLSGIERDNIDIITCTHVLEHVTSKENLIKTLAEFQRILHPNGKIIIILPCAKEEGMDHEDRENVSPLHPLNHTNKWWTKIFSKYFKSESFKARIVFKKSKLKPDRIGDNTFYEEYKSWNIFRLVQK